MEGGTFKRVLKGCEPPFAFEIIPSLIFISTEHVELYTLKKKINKKVKFPWSWTLKFPQSKVGKIVVAAVLGLERCEAVASSAVKEGKAERSQTILSWIFLDLLLLYLA